MPYRIMHLALLTNLLRLSLNRLVFFRPTSDCDGVNFLMRLAVPFVESREVRSSSARLLPTGRKNSVLCAVIGLPLRSSKNSSIEIFFGRPSAWYRNQRLSKSFELYTIDLILKTSPKVSNSLFIHNTSKLTAYNRKRCFRLTLSVRLLCGSSH